MSAAPITVTELTAQIKVLLEQGFARVEVCGEISRLTRASSGHLYFTIKDRHAAISAVVWRSTALRLKTQPEEGGEFVFSGHLSVYEPRGTYQLVVTGMEASGAGRLAAEFERRKQLFAERGWFDTDRKKQLPRLPDHIGIVTSTTAAALEDVKKVLATRPGWLKLSLAPCLVQGSEAPRSIISALRLIAAEKPDLILLVRGGGSIEDLWCFNDEALVEAVVDCPIPVISGIGHEIDHTLADFAADVRAATPSNAAEISCPSRDELRQQLPRPSMLAGIVRHRLGERGQAQQGLTQRLQHTMRRQLDGRLHAGSQLHQQLQLAMQERLGGLRLQLRRSQQRLAPLEPGQQLRLRRQRLAQLNGSLQQALPKGMHARDQQLRRLQQRLDSALTHRLRLGERTVSPLAQRLAGRQSSLLAGFARQHAETARALEIGRERHLQQLTQRLRMLGEKLQVLGPEKVLARGYTLSYDRVGNLVTRASQLRPGEHMRVHFQDGDAHTLVESLER